MKNIVILGSTGSIGTQTLDIVRANRDRFKVLALAAGKNAALMEEQAREFKPELAVLWDEGAAASLKASLADTPVKVLSGMSGIIEAARLQNADIVVGAMVGMIGIEPVIEAIKAGKDIALANKETLVCAGHIIMPLAKQHKVPRILKGDFHFPFLPAYSIQTGPLDGKDALVVRNPYPHRTPILVRYICLDEMMASNRRFLIGGVPDQEFPFCFDMHCPTDN